MIPVAATAHGLVEAFLLEADLTVAGLDETALWMELDAERRITGTTGFELVGRHALIRSVAVRPDLRSSGLGSRLAGFAIDAAAQRGATTAWLFSRRSGPFWQRLGFAQASTADLAAALAGTAQVRLFTETGQLEREVAWRLDLPSAD